MRKNYVHLNLTERDQITQMLWDGKKVSEIAKALGRNKSTISRELERNSSPEYKKYLSHRAHLRAEEDRQERAKDKDSHRGIAFRRKKTAHYG